MMKSGFQLLTRFATSVSLASPEPKSPMTAKVTAPGSCAAPPTPSADGSTPSTTASTTVRLLLIKTSLPLSELRAGGGQGAQQRQPLRQRAPRRGRQAGVE